MSKRNWKIVNGTVITPHRTLANGSVLVLDGKIAEVGASVAPDSDIPVIDARGKFVSPGFIDIHVHGGGGHDFMDNELEGFLEIARVHARYGTTSLLPTTLSCDAAALEETIRVYETAERRNEDGAEFLGLHIEGPYFAMSQRGAQDPRYIRNPDAEEYRRIVQSTPVIKRWSAAPELPGAIEFGRFMKRQGILPAIAHSDAIYEEALEAFYNGFTHITHLYSGMSGVTRRHAFRYAGIVEAAWLIEGMTTEIIADGIHLPPPLLKLVCKIKGPERIALITDAMRAAGRGPGESILGSRQNGLRVLVEDGVAKLPDRSAFAGSVATANELVRNMMRLAGIPLAEAVQMMTSTPARIMGVQDKKGTLEKGKDADITIFDPELNIEKTIIRGRLVYSAPSADHFQKTQPGELSWLRHL